MTMIVVQLILLLWVDVTIVSSWKLASLLLVGVLDFQEIVWYFFSPTEWKQTLWPIMFTLTFKYTSILVTFTKSWSRAFYVNGDSCACPDTSYILWDSASTAFQIPTPLKETILPQSPSKTFTLNSCTLAFSHYCATERFSTIYVILGIFNQTCDKVLSVKIFHIGQLW